MNRRKFFAFLPFAPVGAVMATSAMAKAPCESLAPEKALMTLNAHKPPPPPQQDLISARAPPKYPTWAAVDNYISTDKLSHGITTISNEAHFNKISFGKGMSIKADEHFDEETKVSMAVGKDGHLWLKIGDNWKRVVTE
jgi:hypothetical protein